MYSTSPSGKTPALPQHTLVALVRDRPGTLHRAVTLFRRRSFNIASLHVERTASVGLSRMMVSIEAHSPEPVMRELERLVDVLSVHQVTGDPSSANAHGAVPARWQADGVCEEGETP